MKKILLTILCTFFIYGCDSNKEYSLPVESIIKADDFVIGVDERRLKERDEDYYFFYTRQPDGSKIRRMILARKVRILEGYKPKIIWLGSPNLINYSHGWGGGSIDFVLCVPENTIIKRLDGDK